ncbi:MAG: hypothetical protein ACFHWX_01750 [Bacteroidota bacterium]
MKTLRLTKSLQSEDLIKILKKEISYRFSYCVSENQTNFNVLLKKSPFISTSVSCRNNAVKVEGSHTDGILAIFIYWLGLDYFSSQWYRMEDDVFQALEKYNN